MSAAPAPSSLKLISRTEWGAKDPTGDVKKYLNKEFPINVVYFTLKSGLPDCNSMEECTKVLVEGQQKAITQDKLPDIPYNFVVAKDGTVFEGRGWEKKPDKAILMEPVDFDPRAYDIAFFGDYSQKDNQLPNTPFKAALDLIDVGIRKKHVYQKYDIEAFREDKFVPIKRPGKEKFKNVNKIMKSKDNPYPSKPNKGERQPGESFFS